MYGKTTKPTINKTGNNTMNKKTMKQVVLFLAGAVAVVMVPQIGEQLGNLLGKTITYGD